MMKSLFPQTLLDEQYHISALQVFNWGTFSDLHHIPIARNGFLLVGRSGSGKSTLLDALSALLVPPQWRGFNAAAREGEKGKQDRNLAYYVRGAWSDQTDSDSGEIAKQFLRKGTTWSALALEYRNLSGKIITLIALFILRGQQTRSTDVQTHFMIAERSFDIESELAEFNHDLDIRRLKQKCQDVFHADKFKPYSERFRSLLHIESEMALKLLHKTQSAKNLGDLNLFLREYMLEEPETFHVAERMVKEFAELDAAHQAVVTAREQVQVLSQAKEKHQYFQDKTKEFNQLEELQSGIEPYCANQKKILYHTEINTLDTKILAFTGKEQHQLETLEQLKTHLKRLENQHRAEGGERIDTLKTEIARAELLKQQRMEKHNCVAKACKKLDMRVPENPLQHGELINKARNFNEQWQSSGNSLKNKRDDLRDQLHEITREFSEIRQEIDSLRRQPSNIPAPILSLRQQIMENTNLQETDLPFAGELIEVREEETSWRGAIERLLRGFASSLLVSEQHYNLVSGFVNKTHLGNRLVYYRVTQSIDKYPASIASDSLIHKLALKKNDYTIWLDHELRQRFNYACVDNIQAFRKTERALTKEGQVRHGKFRHEKDDRFAIDDKRQWILGFDNHEKLQLFEQKGQMLAEKISQLEHQIKSIEALQQQEFEKASAWQSMINITWYEIDIAASLDTIASLQRELAQLQGDNISLKTLGEQIEQQQKTIQRHENQLTEIKADLKNFNIKREEYASSLNDLKNHITVSLTPFQQTGLESYFQCHGTLTLSHIESITRKVQNTLISEQKKLTEMIYGLKNSIENIFQQFKHRWPQESADLDASLEAASEFLAKLTRIELDGLPAHEERFFTMLRNQSMENLAALNTHLSQARKDIQNRMELVNESLASAEYNTGTHLQIEVTDKQLIPIKEFRQQVREILNNAWNDESEGAEKRFTVLRSLVESLSGQQAEQQHWRQQVLDVRLHVEFIAREYDANEKEVEVHRSGAGKSGGQREKLTTTCLAAALSYQLGGRDGGIPIYAPVVLDEAFSKADNEFTHEVMKVFTNFGFQMIVATPFKSVMTLEPFIAGACFVDIQDRKHSHVFQIRYNADEKRLDLPAHAQSLTA